MTEYINHRLDEEAFLRRNLKEMASTRVFKEVQELTVNWAIYLVS